MSYSNFVKRVLSNVVSLPFKEKSLGIEEFRVLTYHSIGDKFDEDVKGLYSLSLDKFEKQMFFLSGIDRIFPVRDYSGISITFDDGFLNNLRVVLPVMENLGLPFTVFVTKSHVMEVGGLYLNKLELKELASSPLVSIGSHAMNHVRLPELNVNKQREEILHSKLWLEDVLGRDVELFSYPYGSYSLSTVEIVQESGYKAAFTVDFGKNRIEERSYSYKRTDIFSYDTLRTFEGKLKGKYDWMEFFTKKHFVKDI